MIKRFQTFDGVFTPTLLSILGVIMYLRLGWVVGQVGLKGALIIIVLSNVITLCTGLSLSSIVTNIRVGIGGAYAVISKSLGLEVGGAIGIPLYLSLAVSVAFYITGFTECWVSVFPRHDFLLVSLLAWVILLVISYTSARFAFRLQYAVMAVIALSLVSVFLGKPGIQPLSLFSRGVEELSFWHVFAVFFPAVTGILAGASMSGELKEPEKNIPRGTLSAVGLSFLIYVALAFWFVFRASPEELAGNTTIIIDLAKWRYVVIAGIMGATISSALTMFVTSPRTLLALGKNRIIPFASSLSFINKKGEPTTAIIITALISLITLLVGNLNTIATFLTMIFLITYGMLNVSVFIEQSLGVISFRPSFKISLVFPFLGGMGCVFAMFLINPMVSLVAIIIIIFMYFLLLQRKIKKDWPDVRKGIFIFIAEKALKISSNLPYHPKIWKPDLLIPVEEPEKWDKELAFIKAITFPSGRVTFYNVLAEDHRKRKNYKNETTDKLSSLSCRLKNEGILSTSLVVEFDDFIQGSSVITQMCRGAHFPSNVLCVKMGSTSKKDAVLKKLVNKTESPDLGLIMFKLRDYETDNKEKIINLWIREKSPNVDLAILIALQLEKNMEGRLQLLQVVSNQDGYQKAYNYLSKLKRVMRISRDTEIHIIVGNFQEVLQTAPKARINIFGMTQECDVSFLRNIADTINTSVLFLRDSQHESAIA